MRKKKQFTTYFTTFEGKDMRIYAMICQSDSWNRKAVKC